MKTKFFVILLLILLFSCTTHDDSKILNSQKAELAHSKFTNLKNDYSYNKYKLLIVEYGKNSKIPEIK